MSRLRDGSYYCWLDDFSESSAVLGSYYVDD